MKKRKRVMERKREIVMETVRETHTEQSGGSLKVLGTFCTDFNVY